jgi:lipopolysaccharide export LptBFGC system permease protein LptF
MPNTANRDYASGATARNPLFLRVLRYPVAILIAVTTGVLFSLLFEIAVTMMLRGVVAPSKTLKLILSVVECVASGFYVGFLAGLIAGRRGKLIAAIADFLPLTLLILISLALNRDLLQARASGMSLTDWTWLALVPAVLGGHLATRTKRPDLLEEMLRVFD